MVAALLAGRKTQTRRLLSLAGFRWFSQFGPSDTPGYDWHFRREDGCWCDYRHDHLPIRYHAGDRLWVREAWRTSKVSDELKPSQLCGGGYTRVWYESDRDNCDAHGRYRHARHMPKWASRLTLLVTDVRIERLQDISEADAIAEGIGRDLIPDGLIPGGNTGFGFPGYSGFATAKSAYAALWDSINGPGAWDANPWVVAISFEVKRGNINVL